MCPYRIYVSVTSPPDKLPLLELLSRTGDLMKAVTLVVAAPYIDDCEFLFDDMCEVVEIPERIDSLDGLLQWVIDSSFDDYVFIMSSECTFLKRQQKSMRLSPCDEWDVEEMFDLLHNWLTQPDMPMVGLSNSKDNEAYPYNHKKATRQEEVFGINVPAFKKLGLKMNTLSYLGSLYAILTMLLQGHANRISYDFAWYRQRESNTPPNAKEIHKFWCAYPNYVTTIQDEWDDLVDARVQWGAAFKYGREHHRWITADKKQGGSIGS